MAAEQKAESVAKSIIAGTIRAVIPWTKRGRSEGRGMESGKSIDTYAKWDG